MARQRAARRSKQVLPSFPLLVISKLKTTPDDGDRFVVTVVNCGETIYRSCAPRCSVTAAEMEGRAWLHLNFRNVKDVLVSVRQYRSKTEPMTDAECTDLLHDISN